MGRLGPSLYERGGWRPAAVQQPTISWLEKQPRPAEHQCPLTHRRAVLGRLRFGGCNVLCCQGGMFKVLVCAAGTVCWTRCTMYVYSGGAGFGRGARLCCSSRLAPGACGARCF
jgi:hypothetical protein